MKISMWTFTAGVIAVLLAPHPVVAEPIQITSGSVIYAGGIDIPVTLSGEDFTFSGTTDIVEGIFTPRDQCGVPECVGGTVVDLHSLWLGLAFHSATATYNGVTYPAVGSLSSPASVRTEWLGTLTIPLAFTGGTLTAPISLQGEFAYEGSEFTTVHAPLVGSGTATLNFIPYSAGFPNAFSVQSLRFDIAEAPAATPEPASILLLASGALGLAASRRRTRRAG